MIESNNHMDTSPVLLIQANCLSLEPVRAQLAQQTPPLNVQVAADITAARQALEHGTFAAILLDLDLRGMHELDGLITVSQYAAATPILVFGEAADEGRALAALRAGAQDFLTRAEIESPRVALAVRYAMERFALHRESHSHAVHLQFSEARFRLLINENADAILVVNKAGLIRFANPAAAALFGKSRSELTGTSFEADLHPDTTTMIQIPRAHDVAVAEMRVVETLWSREEVFIATLRDVTEQHRTAAKLQESEERYREFITTSSDGIWRSEFLSPLSIDVPEQAQINAMFFETRVAECNDAWAHMYGFEHKEEALRRRSEMDSMPDNPGNQAMLRTFIRNGYHISGAESRERDRFGNVKIFVNNIQGIVRDGQLVGMWGTQRDVTVERSALQELSRAEAQEKHQRELAQALADSAVVLNSTLHYEQVLDRILDDVGRVVPHDAASIFLIERDTAQMVRGYGVGKQPVAPHIEHLRLKIHEIYGFELMFRSGEPLLISDTAAYAGWQNLAGDWIKSYVGAPLRAQDHTIGFLNLDSGVTNFFTAEHAGDLKAFAALAATALENARLHTEVHHRADALAALYDLTRELGMQLDLDTLLQALVEHAMKLLNASAGSLALYVPETRMLERRVVSGETKNQPRAQMKLGEGLMGRVAKQREPMVLDDYRTWEHRILPSLNATTSAVVAVPLLFGGDLVGVLAIYEEGDTTRRFTQSDVEMLTLLSAHAAAMVHNARLHSETEKRAQQMALLYDAGLALNSVLDTQTLLDFLTRIAMRSVRAERAVFFRFNPAAQELTLEFALGFEATAYKYKTRVSLLAEQGIEAWVARERLPATLEDVEADTRFSPSGDDIASGIWVPIEHDKQLLGVLAVCSTRLNAFGPYDQRLLLLYASQAAVALENARLYQVALAANEQHTVLHWASQEIVSAGLDAERVYEAIHQATARLMPCEAFVIAILDEQEEEIELAYWHDLGGRQPVVVIPPERGISGYVIRTGKPLIVDDLSEWEFDMVRFAHSQQVVSVLAVPLRHGGRVVGMLSAQSYERGVFTPDHRELLEILAAHAAAAVMNVVSANAALDSLERAYLETVLALAKTIDARDSTIGAHSERLIEVATNIANKLELPDEAIQTLRLAAQLHDIGKIGVPDKILLKPGPLTTEEWMYMRRHTEIGADILSPIGQLRVVVPLVRHHQEWFDGSGYPDRLAGEEIPLGARILAVADAFSAITDDRVYRKARSVQEAVAEIRRCAGTQFDPRVVEAFLWFYAPTLETHQALAQTQRDSFGAIGSAEFAENRADVEFDGVFGNE